MGSQWDSTIYSYQQNCALSRSLIHRSGYKLPRGGFDYHIYAQRNNSHHVSQARLSVLWFRRLKPKTFGWSVGTTYQQPSSRTIYILCTPYKPLWLLSWAAILHLPDSPQPQFQFRPQRTHDTASHSLFFHMAIPPSLLKPFSSHTS